MINSRVMHIPRSRKNQLQLDHWKPWPWHILEHLSFAASSSDQKPLWRSCTSRLIYDLIPPVRENIPVPPPPKKNQEREYQHHRPIRECIHLPLNCTWLVVEPPLWKIWTSIGMTILNIWKNTSHVPVTTNQKNIRYSNIFHRYSKNTPICSMTILEIFHRYSNWAYFVLSPSDCLALLGDEVFGLWLDAIRHPLSEEQGASGHPAMMNTSPVGWLANYRINMISNY